MNSEKNKKYVVNYERLPFFIDAFINPFANKLKVQSKAG